MASFYLFIFHFFYAMVNCTFFFLSSPTRVNFLVACFADVIMIILYSVKFFIFCFYCIVMYMYLTNTFVILTLFDNEVRICYVSTPVITNSI